MFLKLLFTVLFSELYIYIYIHCKKCPEAQYILEKLAEISDTDLIITHSLSDRKRFFLCHCISMQKIINDFKACILKGNFKDTRHRKLTELKFIISF